MFNSHSFYIWAEDQTVTRYENKEGKKSEFFSSMGLNPANYSMFWTGIWEEYQTVTRYEDKERTKSGDFSCSTLLNSLKKI